jgi:hypothetical protein
VGRAGQAGDVAEGGAGDERAAPTRREAEQLPQPVDGDPLGLGGERRRRLERGHLVEQRRRPVRGERGRGGAADDVVEEPGPGAVRRGGRADAQQRPHGLVGAEAVLREAGTLQPGQQRHRRGVDHRPVPEAGQVRPGDRPDLVEDTVGRRRVQGVAHGRSFSST